MPHYDAIDRQFGVVFFDNENDPGAAWVSVNGGTAARIDGINELATDTIWWTNVTFEAFFRKTETWKNPWLRHDKYLVVSPRGVMQEWGLDPKTAAANHAAQVVSAVYARVMSLAFRLIRESEPRARMSEVFRGRTLRDDISRLLPEAEYPKGDAAEIIQSGKAYQEVTTTTARFPKGAKFFMLRKPRLSYAFEMLQSPIPRGPFEYLMRKELRSKGDDKIKWIRETSEPCIAEVTIHRIDGDIAPIYGFGNSMEQGKAMPRNWVAHPELLVLTKFADLDVRAAYVGKEYETLGPKLPEHVKDFLQDKFSEYSWSAGVIAETLWRAAALADPERAAQGEARAHSSWRGAWLKAADKSSMFLTAMQLTERGYSVSSYGLGFIGLRVPEEAMNDLIKDGISLGLIPMLVDVPDGLFQQNKPIPWGGDPKSMALAQFTVSGDRWMLWNMDRVPLGESGDERNQIAARIVQERKKMTKG
jgi:hypothetical protein